MICLNNKSMASKNKLIGMLSTLLSSKLSKEEKKSVLETEYELPMTVEMESEAGIMCNLSYAISEEAEKRGIEQGIEALILDNLEDNKPKDVIITKLEKRFKLSKESANAYYEKFATKK